MRRGTISPLSGTEPGHRDRLAIRVRLLITSESPMAPSPAADRGSAKLLFF